MRLYKITAQGDHKLVPTVLFAGSQADAASQRKALTEQGYKRASIETKEVEVPTNKQGLIDFLNRGCE